MEECPWWDSMNYRTWEKNKTHLALFSLPMKWFLLWLLDSRVSARNHWVEMLKEIYFLAHIFTLSKKYNDTSKGRENKSFGTWKLVHGKDGHKAFGSSIYFSIRSSGMQPYNNSKSFHLVNICTRDIMLDTVCVFHSVAKYFEQKALLHFYGWVN